jgi:NADPH-dependent 2,4-dienoyl-CoA reductase/sulfur reductase-like enzyme
MKTIRCQAAIIGAGPAGLAAAISAVDAGAEDVVILERNAHLGGILQQCIHNGFGLSIFEEDLTGPEYAERYISEVTDRRIRCMLNTMVIKLGANREILATSSADGLVRIIPDAVVLAMGCRERTRGAISVPGKRPAGIMTAGTAQRMVNIEGYLPGKRFVILGSGDIGMIMARRFHLEGCAVEAVVECEECVGGLSRNLVQCLQDFEIPLLLRHTVTDIFGDNRIEAVEISPLFEDGTPDIDKARTIDCDTLLLSIGLIPENELSQQAEILLDDRTRGPNVDELFQTTVPGIFAAGNVMQVYDLVDDVTRWSMEAGRNAADYALDRLSRAERFRSVTAGSGVRTAVPQRVGLPDEEVVFQLRSTLFMRNAVLELIDSAGGVAYSKKLSVVRPSQMFSATVSVTDLTVDGDICFQLKENVHE